MCARMRQSFFLGISRSPLTIFLFPSSCSDSSLCFLSLFIKEIQYQLYYICSYSANIDSMQYPQNWTHSLRQLAETSLYERELTKKLQAEAELTGILFGLPLAEYEPLLESTEEVVVFAVAAILHKNVGKVKEHVGGLLTTVNAILKRWYQPNGVLRRAKDELKVYIENTLGQFMGNCLRTLMYKEENKEFINSFLDGMTGHPHYRLYLYFRFIESVSSIDSEISYVSYRTLLTNFESAFLPRIFEALNPYFMSISDSMDISELSFLQNSMSVGEGRGETWKLEFNGKNKFTEVVFLLLENVITFKFNISTKEYEECIESETAMVSFPDTLLSTILRENFLDALYNVLIQLMSTQEFRYQLICLSCLKKILLAKTTYVLPSLQEYFILKNMQGVFKLLKLIVSTNSVSHRSNAVYILQCNNNFISTFGLESKIMREPNNAVYLNQWMELTRSVPLFLLKNDTNAINIENELFMAGVEMMVNLANELKMNNIQLGKEIYYQNYQAYTREFLNAFIVNGQNIMANLDFSFQSFIKAANEILGGVKMVFSYNYGEFMGLLNDCCEHLFKGNGGEYCTGNLILVVRELFRQNKFFQESIFGAGLIKSNSGQLQIEQSKAVEVGVFGQILAKTLNFIIRYQTQSILEYPYLNNSIIIFLSTLLQVCSKKITSDQDTPNAAPYINHEVYSRMKPHLRAGISDEQFLLKCLQSLCSCMHCPKLLDIEYIFQTLLECIERIKWSMNRQYFKYTTIYQEMVKLFTKLTMQPLPAHLVRLRSLLFNIITVLSFDDKLGECRHNIRSTVALLKGEAAEGEWVRMLYDLTGIFQSIDGVGVFKYFIRYFLRDLNFGILIKEIFTLSLAKPAEYLRDALYLSRIMLSDKAGRVSKSQAYDNVYSLAQSILPYWSYCLENGEQLDIEQATIQIYIGARDLFSQSHVNLCILDNLMGAEFKKFMRLLVFSMIGAIENLESSAELSKALFELAGEVTKKIAKPLFNLGDEQIGTGIHQFVNKLMKKLSVNFESIAAGAFEQRLLGPILLTVHNYHHFLRENRRKQHLVHLYNNITRATSDVHDKDLALETIIKIAMEFKQHFSVGLLEIAAICVNLIEFYRIDCQGVSQRLGLTGERDVEELARIFRHVEERKEDFDWLSYQMKDWLTLQTRFINYQVNDY